MTIKEELNSTLKIIKKFIRINKLSVKPKIIVTYTIDTLGCFYFNWDEKSIYINPKLSRLEYKKPRGIYAHGYINSCKMSDVIIHEFGHLIDEKLEINKDFENVQSINLNKYSLPNKTECFAEAFILYITNPFLLKILHKNTYMFMKSKFKSPTSCSKKYFLSIYAQWNKKIKAHAENKLGLVVLNGKIKYNKAKIKRYFENI